MAVLATAVQGLQGNPAFNSAVATSVGTAVNALLSNSGLIGALATAASSVVSGLATDPSILTSLGEVIPAPYGAAILSALSDPAATARLATLVGTLVTGFVGQSGVTSALSDAASQVAAAVLAGTPVSAALQNVAVSLQAVPAFAAALNSTISAAISGILGDQAVQTVVSTVTEQAITNLVNDASAGLPPVVGDVLIAAVNSLVSNDAVQNLIGDVAGTVVSGETTVAQLVPTLAVSVISSPPLQLALAAAVGQGIGALFGDNPVGFVVGQVAGAAAAIAIGMASGLAGLINLFNPGFIASLFAGFTVPAASAYRVDQNSSLVLLTV